MITKKLPLFILIFGLMSSCSLLDQTSPNDIDAENAIKDAESAENALTGIYSSLQSKIYYGGMFPLMGEAASQDASTGGYDVASLDEIGSNAITPSNTFVEELWTGIYYTIANCNYLLGNINKIEQIDLSRRDEIEGQARAIRALAHFDLLRTYGEHWDNNSAFGIPIVNSIQSITDVVARNNVSECYHFITTELEAALNLVNPEDNSQQLMTKTAIEGLLARVYLYQKNYDKAANFAGAVIQNSNFALLEMNAYSDIYNKRRSSESIFELAFDAQNRSDFNSLTYLRFDALRPEIFFMASSSLGVFFANRDNDVRASMVDMNPENNPGTTPDGRSQKYRGEETKDNPAYIIRLAEMFLIRAEALGFANDGIADINTLRVMRGMPEAEAIDEMSFKMLLMNERRAELNFEGHRYFDLARTQTFSEVTQAEAFRACFPIPGKEVVTTNGIVKQNPGY